jgi:putative tryptophan/tyrosine transport system substrate-binding protein
VLGRRQSAAGAGALGCGWPGASAWELQRRDAFLSDAAADPQTAALHWQEVQAAAHTLALQLHPVEVRAATDLEGAFTTMTRQGAEVLVTALSAFTLQHRRQIVALAAQHRLPAMYQGREFMKAGGLMAYGMDRLDQGCRAAIYVDKILKGAKPGDLPIEQPTKFELVINLKTAQVLGLTIPPTLLFQADEVLRQAAVPCAPTTRCVLQNKPFKSV